MDYFNLLELPIIKGVSEKQIRYAEYLRDKEVYGDRAYWGSIACSQHYKKLNYATLDHITRTVLTCNHAGVIIDTLKQTGDRHA